MKISTRVVSGSIRTRPFDFDIQVGEKTARIIIGKIYIEGIHEETVI